ncbi:phage tail protein [Thalassococcus sp. BH17M4-6]|uniref:phage tail protein n=1 Tax=Thalassococcus sp. BH17M4-6 TaxID=3413148 RepID=UPI003BE43D3A
MRPFSTLLAATCAAVLSMSPDAAKADSQPYIADIMLVGFNFCPRNWLPAEGQLLAISSNQAMFSLLGTTYGGDGRTTFGLPDLRGIAPVSVGQAPGLAFYREGQRQGREQYTLTVLDLPSHSHMAQSSATSELKATTTLNDVQAPQGNRIGELPAFPAYASTGDLTATLAQGSASTAVTTQILPTGGGQPINLRQPTIAMKYCIAQYGLFPPRS